jgi:hypothetical protein
VALMPAATNVRIVRKARPVRLVRRVPRSYRSLNFSQGLSEPGRPETRAAPAARPREIQVPSFPHFLFVRVMAVMSIDSPTTVELVVSAARDHQLDGRTAVYGNSPGDVGVDRSAQLSEGCDLGHSFHPIPQSGRGNKANGCRDLETPEIPGAICGGSETSRGRPLAEFQRVARSVEAAAAHIAPAALSSVAGLLQ